MKKIYYEVLEYDNDVLKNMYFFPDYEILESKRAAEQCFKDKVKSMTHILKQNSNLKYQLVLTIMNDYHSNRYILNESKSAMHLFESRILSEETGRLIEIPKWPEREQKLLNELI